MSDYECSFEEFKKRTKEFLDVVDTLNKEELDHIYTELSLSYINMNEETQKHESVIAFMMATQKHIERSVELKNE